MKWKFVLISLFLISPTLLIVACSKKGHSNHSANQTVQKYHCPMHPNYISDKPGDCPICGMKLIPIEAEVDEPTDKKILFYRHPMNPKVTSPVPLKDEMGMDYVPVYAEEETAPPSPVEGKSTVKISAEKQQLIGVKTEIIKKRELKKLIRTVGKVAYDPELYSAEEEFLAAVKTYKKLQVTPSPYPLPQRGEGKTGDSLPVEERGMDSIAENAESLMQSAKFKLKLLGLSEEQIGKIVEAGIPDKSLLVTGDSKYVWVYAPIYEYELGFVKIGQSVKITSPSIPSLILTGQIVAIDPVLNPETRSVRVRIIAENKSGILRPETYLNAEIEIPLGYLLAITDSAIIDTGTRQIAFTDKGGGYFEPREVKLGDKGDNYYVLKSGISEGEKVVVSANFLIDSESQLKAALQQMTGGEGGHKH